MMMRSRKHFSESCWNCSRSNISKNRLTQKQLDIIFNFFWLSTKKPLAGTLQSRGVIFKTWFLLAYYYTGVKTLLLLILTVILFAIF
jgi:hypothetical protein